MSGKPSAAAAEPAWAATRPKWPGELDPRATRCAASLTGLMHTPRTTPTRIRIAATLTGVIVALLAVSFVVGLGGDEEKAATSTTATTTTGVPMPPPLYEIDPSWNLRGHSRFAGAERNKRRAGGSGNLVEGVENVPPARVNITTTTIEQRVISLEESGAVTTAPPTSYPPTSYRSATSAVGLG